jgi:hypothetical protein
METQKIIKVCFFAILLLLAIANTIVGQTEPDKKQSYYKVSEIRIFINDKADILELRKQGLGFDNIKLHENYFDVMLDSVQINILNKSGYSYQIIIDDVTKDYLERTKESREKIKLQKPNKLSGFDYGSMGGFYTFNEVIVQLDTMHSLYPNLITIKDSIGSSIEGRTIWAVKISDNPEVDEDEPEIFYNSLTHAREPEGMMVVIYFMYYLLENYGTDPEVTYLVNNRELYFVPVINPDGYVYNQQISANGGGMWRKNRRNGGGVDLARNFGYKWGYDNFGSSADPGNQSYRGTGPFSEPETEAIRNFCQNHNFSVSCNYHTFWDVIFPPWSYNMEETPDSTIFNNFIGIANSLNGYRNGAYVLPPEGYPANGSVQDWMYGEAVEKNRIYGVITEVGTWNDGFWPVPERILPLAEENLYSNLVYAWGPGIIIDVPYISSVFLSSYYYRSPLDTVKIYAVESNPGDHTSTVSAQIRTSDNNLVSEIQLNKIDSMFVGSFVLNSTGEDYYKVRLQQNGIDIPMEFFYDNLRFTTAGPVVLDSLKVTRLDFNSIFLHNLFFSNKSLSTEIPLVAVKAQSVDNCITTNGGKKDLGNLNPQTTIKMSGGFLFNLNECSLDSIDLIMKISSRDTTYWESKIRIGIPPILEPENLHVLMYDEANDLTNWTSQGGWNITNEQYVSSPTSFTDSPNKNYSSNSTSILSYKKQFYFINTIYSFLEFDGLWDIEYGWDYGMVQLSNDYGSTWIPLAGQYTEPGGFYPQPRGLPLYDGTQPQWVHEIIDISDYANRPLNFRFLFKTDQAENYDGWYVDNIKLSTYATVLGDQFSVDKLYARKNIDSVRFRIRFVNFYNHPFTANLIYRNADNTEVDSIHIYGVLSRGDDIYGAYIPPKSTEDFFSLSISTVDHQTNKYIYSPDICRFTTAGPLELDSVTYTKGSLDFYNIKPFIKNKGVGMTITGAKVRLYCDDPWVASISTYSLELPEITPGTTAGPNLSIIVSYIDSIFPGYFNLRAEISIDGWTYWKDSIQTIITGVEDKPTQQLTFKLEQNYPNPFNPITKIGFQIANFGFVSLKVYDVLGREVATLVNEHKPAGKYEVEFNPASDIRNMASGISAPGGYASGVYFYRLTAGGYIATKKMILLK